MSAYDRLYSAFAISALSPSSRQIGQRLVVPASTAVAWSDCQYAMPPNVSAKRARVTGSRSQSIAAIASSRARASLR